MNRTSTGAMRASMAGSLLACAMLLFVALPASGQTSQSDQRWQSWIGCWAPVSALGAPTDGAVVCVVPVAGSSAVEFATVAGGKIVGRERVEANGAQRASTKDGCTGWERAQWSPQANRVYLRSEYSCANAPKRAGSGMLVMSSPGEWLSVQSMTEGKSSGVRVLRYDAAAVPSVLASEVPSNVRNETPILSVSPATVEQSVGLADVIEASHAVDASVVQTWLAQRGQGFDLDAKKLVTLADAQVPAPVIDMMVALSYPSEFSVASAATRMQRGSVMHGTSGRRVFASMYSDDYYGAYGYGANGLAPFGAGYYYSPYASAYAGGLGYGWYTGQPIIIVNGDTKTSTPHGSVQKGRGYVPGGSGNSGTNTVVPVPRQTQNAGSGGATTSSGGGSSNPPQETRTAKPRP